MAPHHDAAIPDINDITVAAVLLQYLNSAKVKSTHLEGKQPKTKLTFSGYIVCMYVIESRYCLRWSSNSYQSLSLTCTVWLHNCTCGFVCGWMCSVCLPYKPDGVGVLPVCRNQLGKQRVALSGYLRITSLRDGANAAHRAAAHNRWVCSWSGPCCQCSPVHGLQSNIV